MRFIAKITILSTLFAFAMFILGGALVWLANVRQDDFYLRSSFRSNALASFWIHPGQKSQGNLSLNLNQVSVSFWLKPGRTNQAFAHFDDWMQEYALIRDETAEAAGDESYVLPPSPLPSPQNDSQDDESSPEKDPYDEALSVFLSDLWESEFITLGGSAHVQAPFWTKPLLGWAAVLSQTRFFSSLFETSLSYLPARSDGADFLSWLSSLPFAHLDAEAENSPVDHPGRTEPFVHRLVIEIGGREIADILSHLCELGNLEERYCGADEDAANPLEPLLYLSENFRVQFHVYWSLRGEHFVWSNNLGCLKSLISQPAPLQLNCGNSPDVQNHFSERELIEFMNLKTSPAKKWNASAGYWLNQEALKNGLERVVNQLNDEHLDGTTWLQDLLQSAGGDRFVKNLRLSLEERAHEWPVLGAEAEFRGANIGALMTYAKNPLLRGSLSSQAPVQALRQFDILNSLMSAWLGLPRSTARLAESKPWMPVKAFWRAESVYHLGWSEQE